MGKRRFATFGAGRVSVERASLLPLSPHTLSPICPKISRSSDHRALFSASLFYSFNPMAETPHSPVNVSRFVQIADAIRETNPWTDNEWLCRPGIVAAEKLLLVRANMATGRCHPFHFHPHREEIIYVVYGRAEQWVGEEYRILGPGEIAHIPAGVVHGTYNPHKEPLVFLAMLSPASLPPDLPSIDDPADVGGQEPWVGIRRARGLAECVWSGGTA